MSLQDQLSVDVDMPDLFVNSEQWTGFLQEVLETTATAYLMLQCENAVQFHWKEDTFTLQMVERMKKIIRLGRTSLCAQVQQYIYTPEMVAGHESSETAVRLDIKVWHRNWYNEDEIYFTWECKLIVDKAREVKHRRLVPEYITNGIVRFLDTNWRYSQDVNNAGILGYVLYGEVAQIVEAINQEMLAIPQRLESSRKQPKSSKKDVRAIQALQAASKLSSSDQLKLCNPSPVSNSIFYESHHHRHFCDQDIHLYHFFLSFDFAT